MKLFVYLRRALVGLRAGVAGIQWRIAPAASPKCGSPVVPRKPEKAPYATSAILPNASLRRHGPFVLAYAGGNA